MCAQERVQHVLAYSDRPHSWGVASRSSGRETAACFAARTDQGPRCKIPRQGTRILIRTARTRFHSSPRRLNLAQLPPRDSPGKKPAVVGPRQIKRFVQRARLHSHRKQGGEESAGGTLNAPHFNRQGKPPSKCDKPGSGDTPRLSRPPRLGPTRPCRPGTTPCEWARCGRRIRQRAVYAPPATALILADLARSRRTAFHRQTVFPARRKGNRRVPPTGCAPCAPVLIQEARTDPPLVLRDLKEAALELLELQQPVLVPLLMI